MKRRALTAALYFIRAIGGFWIARKLTADRVRILCYHGASLGDEHLFQPGLFISPSVFERRLELIAQSGLRVVPLDEAIDALDSRSAKNLVAITIDDGWKGTATIMAPLLKKYGLPATLYLSTYYFQKGTQVFNVALRYLFWQCCLPEHTFKGINFAPAGDSEALHYNDGNALLPRIEERAKRLASAEERQNYLRTLAAMLEIDWQQVEERGSFFYLSEEEARDLHLDGIDLQLHTHRHQFPTDDLPRAHAELVENRAAMASVAQSPLVHLCYPSGEYSSEQFSMLAEQGVRSGTTVIAGLNRGGQHLYELRRTLDSDTLSNIELEAELCGLMDLIRDLRRRAS